MWTELRFVSPYHSSPSNDAGKIYFGVKDLRTSALTSTETCSGDPIPETRSCPSGGNFLNFLLIPAPSCFIN